MKKVNILPGSKFGSLVVVREVDRIPVGKELRRAAEVLCSCGNTVVVRYNSLVTGNTTSCGCKPKGPQPKNREHKPSRNEKYLLKIQECLADTDLSFLECATENLTSCSDVWLTCKTSGYSCKFKRRVSLLLSGITNCPCKARSGFSSSRPATLYLIRFNLQCGSHFYKYGITHNFEERSKILERHNNKPLQLISRWEYLVGQDARVAEKRIKKSIPSAQSRSTMPDGWTETFDPKHLMKFYELMGVRY